MKIYFPLFSNQRFFGLNSEKLKSQALNIADISNLNLQDLSDDIVLVGEKRVV